MNMNILSKLTLAIVAIFCLTGCEAIYGLISGSLTSNDGLWFIKNSSSEVVTVEYNLLPQDNEKTEGTATIQPGDSAAIARVAIKASKDRLPEFYEFYEKAKNPHVTIFSADGTMLVKFTPEDENPSWPDFFSEDSWTRSQHYEDITGTDVAVWTYEF